MLQILGFRAPGKVNLPETLGPHCRDLVPTFRAGCFLKSTVPAFSSFSDFQPRHASLWRCERVFHFMGREVKGLRSPAPRTEYKTPLIPKMHLKIHPEPSPETKTRKKLRKIYENSRVSYIFRNFFVFWFRERVRGVFWGAFWGSEGFCILYGAQEIAIKGR